MIGEHKSKIKALSITLCVMLLPLITFAQGDTPADGCDPYDGCQVPLDTWVLILVIAALFYGAYQLQRKKTIAAS